MNIFFLTKLQVEEGLFVWRKQGAQGEYTTPPSLPPPLSPTNTASNILSSYKKLKKIILL